MIRIAIVEDEDLLGSLIDPDAINAPLIYALLQQTACTIVSRIAISSSPFA